MTLQSKGVQDLLFCSSKATKAPKPVPRTTNNPNLEPRSLEVTRLQNCHLVVPPRPVKPQGETYCNPEDDPLLHSRMLAPAHALTYTYTYTYAHTYTCVLARVYIYI